ncbi:hypothetical protein ACLQ29_18110 [Micromonospora sp. DT228]|uniref:hypothetical protein n=1 Tax=Micromonospora sp. DT228 TaxID=3393443 RepID=UPI003CF92052
MPVRGLLSAATKAGHTAGFVVGSDDARGRRLFPDADAPTGLRLAESRVFGNGVVLLRHERAR